MIDLEKEKKKLELKRVRFARDEMDFRILERLSDIERLKENMKIQDERIAELELELGAE